MIAYLRRLRDCFCLLDTDVSNSPYLSFNLLMYNFPLTELSMRLGHADPQITLRVYSHFVSGMESNIDDFMTKVGT